MNVNVFLTVTVDIDTSGKLCLENVTVRKTKPNINHKGLTFNLNMDIPDELFIRPVINIDASVPALLSDKPIITTDVTNSLAEHLQKETGVHVKVSPAETMEKV